ncbi:hypothetical protein D3C77_212730 [compost metagenome]
MVAVFQLVERYLDLLAVDLDGEGLRILLAFAESISFVALIGGVWFFQRLSRLFAFYSSIFALLCVGFGLQHGGKGCGPGIDIQRAAATVGAGFVHEEMAEYAANKQAH